MWWRTKTESDKAFELVYDLLISTRDWQIYSHVWFHPVGVTIWIANKDYGLDIKLNAKDRHDYATQSTPNGGMKLNKLQRKKIWKYIKNGTQQTSDVLAFARRIEQYYTQ